MIKAIFIITMIIIIINIIGILIGFLSTRRFDNRLVRGLLYAIGSISIYILSNLSIDTAATKTACIAGIVMLCIICLASVIHVLAILLSVDDNEKS